MSERKFLVNRIRIGLVGLVVLALSGVTAGGALADSTGRGTAAASVTLLDVTLGNVQHLKVLADVRFLLPDHRGTATWYRINDACVECFPTAADIVMGHPVPAAPAR